jgi:hypothetical protein
VLDPEHRSEHVLRNASWKDSLQPAAHGTKHGAVEQQAEFRPALERLATREASLCDRVPIIATRKLGVAEACSRERREQRSDGRLPRVRDVDRAQVECMKPLGVEHRAERRTRLTSERQHCDHSTARRQRTLREPQSLIGIEQVLEHVVREHDVECARLLRKLLVEVSGSELDVERAFDVSRSGPLRSRVAQPGSKT